MFPNHIIKSIFKNNTMVQVRSSTKYAHQSIQTASQLYTNVSNVSCTYLTPSATNQLARMQYSQRLLSFSAHRVLSLPKTFWQRNLIKKPKTKYSLLKGSFWRFMFEVDTQNMPLKSACHSERVDYDFSADRT